MRRVVVTGLGVVSSIGNNQQEVLESLRQGRSGIVFAEEYAEHGFRSQVHGALKIDLEQHVDRKLRRFMGDGAAFNYVAMNEAIADAGLSGVYNVGTGRNYSFNETVELLNETLGTDIEPAYEPVKLSNYNYAQRADASKLRTATGWEPRISFQEGVRQVCAPYLD